MPHFRRTVDGAEQLELAFFPAHFGNINMKIADGVSLERLLGLVTIRIRQPGNTIALQTAMQ